MNSSEPNNHILEYHAEIKSGRIAAGLWIIRLYDIIVQGMETGGYVFNAAKAGKVIKFIETFCRHCEGRDDTLKLELWQKAFLSIIFGIVDEDGARVFREALLIVGRKNGKTLLASAITAYMAYMDGEYGAKIYCVAPKLEQAGILFNNFHQMIQKDPDLIAEARKRRLDIYIEQSNTVIKPLAFSAKRSDGFNPHLVVNDEIAAWAGDSGLKMYEVMKSALGARRQPMILSISTAGYVNDGVYDELINRATSFLKGNSGERRLIPFLYAIDDPEKWSDLNELKKANPNMGVSVREDFFTEEIAVAEKSLSKKAEFLAKYCNVKQNSSAAWLDYADVNKICVTGLTLDDFRDSYAVGGIDLSQTTDLTAACALIEKKGLIYAFAKFFTPEARLPVLQALDAVPYDIFRQQGLLCISGEHRVNYKDVMAWFEELRSEYGLYILEIGYDRVFAGYLVEEMTAAGFKLDDVRQGENLSPVIMEFEGLIKEGGFIIVDNNLLKAHFLNVALKRNLETRRCKAVKIEQRARIDGFVSVIDAMTVRQKYWGEIGDYLRNE